MKKRLAALCTVMVILLSLTACSFSDSPKLYLSDISISANQITSYYVDFVQIYYRVDGTNYFIYEKHPTQENGRSIEFVTSKTDLQIPDLEIDLPANTDFTLFICVSTYNVVTSSNSFYIESAHNTDSITSDTISRKKIKTQNDETFNLEFTLKKY